ncbi:MAG: DUF5309 family protein [Methanobrevibacter sp.]|jgi:hypothetical protein|nr:DUF5309 family protein [Methanobrevibacter sp.]
MSKDLASTFADAKDMNELMTMFQAEMKKATQTTSSTSEIIEIDYDNEIKTRLITEAPFLRFLEEKGRVQTSTSSVIGWRTKEAKTSSSFIPEIGGLPDYGGKDWDKATEVMRTIVYPISVSKMAQLANGNVDLINDDRQDGYADIAARKDKAFLLGDTSTDSNSWNGINKLAENKVNLNNEAISMDIVDDLLDEVIAQGGNPDGIVTSARVARVLTREQQKNNFHVDKLEFVPGGWVRSYYTPNGEIPIITNRNYLEGNLAIVDSSAVINKTLLPVSEFPLANTKLVDESVLATFTAFGIPSPQKLGFIENIGFDIPSIEAKSNLTVPLTDDEDNPLDNIEVKLLNSSKNIIQTQTTNAEGIAVFAEISNGDYFIRINKQTGYEIFDDKPVTVNGDTTEPVVLTIEE